MLLKEILSLIIVGIITATESINGIHEDLACKYDEQPSYFLEWSERYHKSSEHFEQHPCLFTRYDHIQQLSLELSQGRHASGIYGSKIEISEMDSIPQSQAWSHCGSCFYSNGEFAVLSSDASSPYRREGVINTSSIQSFDATWSQWHEFFYSSTHSDSTQIKVKEKDGFINNTSHTAGYYVSVPVFIFPMITFHVGHILVDLLEAVYHTMMARYGRIVRESLIIIDVAGHEERRILQEKLYLQCGGDFDVFGKILQLFTSRPILTMDLFRSIPSNNWIHFKDLHLGLNISKSFCNHGYKYHPNIFSMEKSPELVHLQEDYQQFAHYIKQNLPSYIFPLSNGSSITESQPEYDNKDQINVLFIQRTNDRVIVNIMEIIDSICSSPRLSCVVADLSTIPFSTQLKLFKESDVIITAAGTAVHNLLFCRPEIIVIILMQRDWCPWSWMYANQAVLLSMNPYVICTDHNQTMLRYPQFDRSSHSGRWNHGNETSRHLTRNFWKQGPRMAKGGNITVDTNAFKSIFQMSLGHRGYQGETGLDSVTLQDVSRGWSDVNYEVEGEDILHDNRHSNETDTHDDGSLRIDSHQLTGKKVMFEFFISHVQISHLTRDVDSNPSESPDKYKLSIMGELVADSDTLQLIGESFPYLSVCIEFSDIYQSERDQQEMVPYCSPLFQFSYYSDIIIHMDQSALLIHAWIQSSSKPFRGILRHSDDYFMIDCRLNDGGISLFQSLSHIQVNVSIASGKKHLDHRESSINSSFESPDPKQLFIEPILYRFYYKQSSIQPSKFAFQRYIHSYCRDSQLSRMGCLSLVTQISKYLYLRQLHRELSLPEIQYKPSKMNPFVFLHIEKTAGTTLREFIYEAAIKNNLEHLIPCHGGLDCLIFSFPIKNATTREYIKYHSNISVVAGHFNWDVWNHLSQYQRSMSQANDSIHSFNETFIVQPSCLVIGRHPIDRAISYYYHRCYLKPFCSGYGKRLNDLSIEDFLSILVNMRDGEAMMNSPENTSLVSEVSDDSTQSILSEEGMVMITDEGLSDAACRTMAGLRITSGMIYTPNSDPIQVPSPLLNEHVDKALTNTEKCVIGLIEEWDETLVHISHFFPWIDFSNDSSRMKMNIVRNKEKRDDLRPDLQRIILEYNACDVKLYDKMLEQFKKQQLVVHMYE